MLVSMSQRYSTFCHAFFFNMKQNKYFSLCQKVLTKRILRHYVLTVTVMSIFGHKYEKAFKFAYANRDGQDQLVRVKFTT